MFGQIRTLALTVVVVSSLAGCASTQNATIDYNQAAWNQLVGEGRQHADAGRTHEAITSFIGAIDLNATAPLWHSVGTLYLRNGEEYPAMTAFEQALGEDSSYAPAMEDLGLLLLHWKQKEKARAVFTQALKLDNTLWRAHNAMGVIADLEGHFEQAELSYQTALEHKPESPDILNNMGYSQFLKNEPEAASEFLVEAVKLDANHGLAWTNLAKVMAREGRYADAFNILERSYPTAIAYHDVGYIALLNDDFVRAEDYMTKALNASPTYFDEAFRNRTTARNRLIGNREGTAMARRDAEYPYCTGLAGSDC